MGIAAQERGIAAYFAHRSESESAVREYASYGCPWNLAC